MSPIERWENALQVETIRLPMDAGELEIICCEWDNVAVSHTGIEKANCIFNSHELQELRRRHSGVDNLCVDIKWNKRLLRHIWVLSPDTGEWLCVANRDAAKAQMSADEVAIAKKLAQLPEGTAEVVKRVASRRARHALANELSKEQTRAKRNLTKKLGIKVQPDAQTGQTQDPTQQDPTPQATATDGGKHQAAPPAASAEAAEAADPAMASTAQEASSVPSSPAPIQIPIFNVVKASPALPFTEESTQ